MLTFQNFFPKPGPGPYVARDPGIPANWNKKKNTLIIMIKILFVPRNIKIHSRSFYSLKCQKVKFFPVWHCVNIFFQYHTLSTIKFSKSRLSNARTCLMKCMCMINRMLSHINIKGRSPEKRLSQHERTNHKGQKSPLFEILQTRVHTNYIP